MEARASGRKDGQAHGTVDDLGRDGQESSVLLGLRRSSNRLSIGIRSGGLDGLWSLCVGVDAILCKQTC